MPKIKWGGLGIQNASGTINKKNGGTTILKNGTTRTHVVPSPVYTARTSIMRSALRDANAIWSLSENVIGSVYHQAWIDACASGRFQVSNKLTGAPIQLSPKEAYISRFLALRSCGLDTGILHEPLPDKVLEVMILVAVRGIQLDNQFIIYHNWNFPSPISKGDIIQIYASPPLRPTLQTANPGLMRKIAQSTPISFSGASTDLSLNYQQIFGTNIFSDSPVGYLIHCRATITQHETGQVADYNPIRGSVHPL